MGRKATSCKKSANSIQTPSVSSPSSAGSDAALEALDERVVVNRLSAVGIGGNIALAVFKLFAGVVGNSGAMVSDAVHSLSDVLATSIAYLGVRMSKRDADASHPYGHERFECLASLALGLILAMTALGIGWNGVQKVVSGDYSQLAMPGAIALVAAVVSIAVKESMFWYTRHYAKALDSAAFMADAWHHRSDALSSVGALLGIGAAMAGFPIGDPLACVLISLLILKVAFDVLRDAVDKMVDAPCSEEFESEVARVIKSTPGLLGIDSLRTRKFGNKAYVDVEIAADGNLTLRESHVIAEAAHDAVERTFPSVKHIMIHVNPYDEWDSR